MKIESIGPRKIKAMQIYIAITLRKYIVLILLLSFIYAPQIYAQACANLFFGSHTRWNAQEKSKIDLIEKSLPENWNKIPTWLKDTEYSEVYSVLAKKGLFSKWLWQLQIDVTDKMNQDRVPNLLRKLPNVKRKYLDMVVSERAFQYGFVLDKNGKPFLHKTRDNKSFRERFKKGEIFYDYFSIIPIPNKVRFFVVHGIRSHALQLLFLAEHMPNFIETYKQIGRENDFWVWDDYFDNALGGNITNNGLFVKYVFMFL